jgi:CubicO group peptidase (beta-lactamase class C family)
MPNENVYGNGGLLTTAEDLLVWNDYYLNGKLGSPSLLQNNWPSHHLTMAKDIRMPPGLMVDSLNGWPSVTHSGATAGYRANLDHFPQQGLSIAWVSNTGQPDMSDMPSPIRNLLVKNMRHLRAIQIHLLLLICQISKLISALIAKQKPGTE